MTRAMLPADVRQAATVEAVIALAATTNPADGWVTDAIVDQRRQELAAAQAGLAAAQANRGTAAMDCGRLGAERAALHACTVEPGQSLQYPLFLGIIQGLVMQATMTGDFDAMREMSNRLFDINLSVIRVKR